MKSSAIAVTAFAAAAAAQTNPPPSITNLQFNISPGQDFDLTYEGCTTSQCTVTVKQGSAGDLKDLNPPLSFPASGSGTKINIPQSAPKGKLALEIKNADGTNYSQQFDFQGAGAPAGASPSGATPSASGSPTNATPSPTASKDADNTRSESASRSTDSDSARTTSAAPQTTSSSSSSSSSSDSTTTTSSFSSVARNASTTSSSSTTRSTASSTTSVPGSNAAVGHAAVPWALAAGALAIVAYLN